MKKNETATPSEGDVDAGAGYAAQAEPSSGDQIEYSVSPGLAGLLRKLGVSFVITSYQSGLMYCIGRNRDGGVNVHQTAMPKPMGLGRDDEGGLVLAGEYQIMRLRNGLAPEERINHMFDACYAPRTVHVTGRLDAHDVSVDGEDRPIFVNTRYNCLATVSATHSFEPLWRPGFISGLVDEDRCHLNGLAMERGRPRFVTAVSRSDTIDGWRDRRADGGVVIDVEKDEIVCWGLSMPHSPVLYCGDLWVLNSGTGELGVVNQATGGFEARVFCPGFVRGLAFYKYYAFVGLSKPRYKRFEGLVLEERLREADSDPWCGVQIIDLSNGACTEWFRIDGKVSELYDVEVLPNVVCPMAVGPSSPEVAKLVTVAK